MPTNKPVSPERSIRRGTIQEAAEEFNVSTKTIRRYITQGRIEAERIGPRLIRVNLDSLDQLGRSLQYTGGDSE